VQQVLAQWKGLAEERERRVKELEDLLKAEREAREGAASRNNQVRGRGGASRTDQERQ
jgi:hypothetical protein